MALNIGDDGAYVSEINITPLVDVVLVLLIIFMMIIPIMMRGYDVDVPGETVAAPPSQEVEQIVLHIDIADCPVVDPPASAGLPDPCTVRLGDESVTVTELQARVAATFGAREPQDRVLFLAAHRSLNYEGVMRVLDAARSGVDGLRIGLVTESAE